MRSSGHVFREPRLAPSTGLTPFAGGVGHAQPLSKPWPQSASFSLASSSGFTELLVWAVTGGFSRVCIWSRSSGW